MRPISIKDRRQSSRNRFASRRRTTRVRARCALFYESSQRALFGSVDDLNPRGVFVHTAEPDSPGCRAVIRLCLPDSTTLLKITCRVVWSNRFAKRGPIGMALLFESTQPWQGKRIAAVMLERAGWQAFPGLKDRLIQGRSMG